MAWMTRLQPASRKLLVMLVSVAAVVANGLAGKPLDDATLWTALGLVSVWLIGQGIADAGQQGGARAAARAEAQDAARPVWADTSAPDAADVAGPKPLNG
jgi:hypothetical protein